MKALLERILAARASGSICKSSHTDDIGPVQPGPNPDAASDHLSSSIPFRTLPSSSPLSTPYSSSSPTPFRTNAAAPLLFPTAVSTTSFPSATRGRLAQVSSSTSSSRSHSSLSSSILRDSADQILQNQEMADQLETLYQRMGKLAGQEVCPMCLARGTVRYHPLVNCQDLPDNYIVEVIRPFKDKMKQVRYMLCWFCWLPKPKGDVKFHQDQKCVFYPPALPEALCCLWRSPLKQQALTDLNIEVETEEEWGIFLRTDQGRGKMQRAWTVGNWLLGNAGL